MNTRTNYMNPVAIGLIMVIFGMTFALAQFKVVPVMPGEQVALMMSVFTFTGIILALPTGGLVQKFGPKKVVMCAAALLIIGSAIGGIVGAEGGTALVMGRIVEGVGFGIIAVAGPAMVSIYTEPSKVGRSMGIWVCYISIGQIIAFNLTPTIVNSMGFGNVWFLYAAITLLTAIIVQFTMKAPVGPAPAADAPAQEKVSLSMAVNKEIILFGIGYCGFNCLMLALLNFGAGSAVETAGMSPEAANLMASIPMIGCFISGPLFGNLSMKIGCKKLMIVGMLGAVVGSLMVFSTSIPIIYAGAVLFGLLGLGVPGVAFAAVPQLVNDPRVIGLGTGIMTTFQALGMFLASVAFLAFVSLGGSYFMGAVIWSVSIGVISIVLFMVAKFK